MRAAAASQELSWTEAAVLKRLEKNGPATTADGMKPQSMGAIVTVLEDLGMVERTPHPTDGRQMHIVLTAKGAAMRKSIGHAKQTWLARAIDQLAENDREKLFEAGRIIRGLVEK